jgi:hypothetical protein
VISGAAAVSDAADIDGIDDYGRAWDNADQQFFLEAGWVSGDAGAMYLEEHGRGGRGGSGYKISLEGYKDINGKIGRGTRDRSLEAHV